MQLQIGFTDQKINQRELMSSKTTSISIIIRVACLFWRQKKIWDLADCVLVSLVRRGFIDSKIFNRLESKFDYGLLPRVIGLVFEKLPLSISSL